MSTKAINSRCFLPDIVSDIQSEGYTLWKVWHMCLVIIYTCIYDIVTTNLCSCICVCFCCICNIIERLQLFNYLSRMHLYSSNIIGILGLLWFNMLMSVHCTFRCTFVLLCFVTYCIVIDDVNIILCTCITMYYKEFLFYKNNLMNVLFNLLQNVICPNTSNTKGYIYLLHAYKEIPDI